METSYVRLFLFVGLPVSLINLVIGSYLICVGGRLAGISESRANLFGFGGYILALIVPLIFAAWMLWRLFLIF